MSDEPEGWKLVPIEPTPEMLAPYHGLNRTRDTSNLAERIYAYMLKHAPAYKEKGCELCGAGPLLACSRPGCPGVQW